MAHKVSGEPFSSAAAFCAGKQQGKSAVDLCVQTLQAYFGAGEVPLLLPG
jgi:hypothetical protein